MRTADYDSKATRSAPRPFAVGRSTTTAQQHIPRSVRWFFVA